MDGDGMRCHHLQEPGPSWDMPKGEEPVMMKLTNKVLAAASTAMVAGAVTVAGLTAASASPATRPSAVRIEHFQLMTTSATSASESIIASGGVFTAGGVDFQGNKVDRVVFPGGTFKIAHSSGTGKQTFSPKTCLNVINLHGTYTLGHGTGKYKGISGHGKYQLSILFVDSRNSKGNCSQTKPPVAFQQIIKAQGPTHL
jgi:hypothetical protein